MTPLPDGPRDAGARARATMRDVAGQAGVSVKTVSRVVNGEPGVSPALTARVQRAAKDLDFRPNLGARSLRRSDGRTASVGLVLQDLANPFSSTLLRAVEDVAHTRSVAVLAGSIDENLARERDLVTAFSSRRVDGLIIMPTGDDQSHFLAERHAGVPMVFVDRTPVGLPADAVVTANREGARDGVRHLLRAGHRRIAFLGDLSTIATARERFAGYADAMREAGLTPMPGLVATDLATMETAKEATEQMAALTAPPTALFAAQNLVTIGAVRALRRLGLQHQVALVGFDDFLLADLLEPAVTVVAQDAQQIGHLAGRRLFARIDGDEDGFRTEVVPTSIVVRGSGEIAPPA